MLDELKEEEIVNKVGGRFKLSTLIQKRMIALNQGARPLVDLRGRRQDDDRDPGDHAGQDLPRPVGQPADERADRGGGRGDGRSYPAVRIAAAGREPADCGEDARKLAALAGRSQEDESGCRVPARGRGGDPGPAALAMRRG